MKGMKKWENPFNDKTEDRVKFRLQDQIRKLEVQNTTHMIIAENYNIMAENWKIIEEPCISNSNRRNKMKVLIKLLYKSYNQQ